MKVRELDRKVVKKSVKSVAKPKPKTKVKATPKTTVKKPNKKDAAKKILERHRLRLTREANDNKKPTKAAKSAKPVKPAKATPKKVIERKHLTRNAKPMLQKAPTKKRAKLIAKSGGPGGKELRQASKAAFAAHLARVAARERAAKGIVLAKMEVKTPTQKVLALQVRTTEKPEWGILKSFVINDYTPQKQLNKYTEELKDLQLGWIVTNYFGYDAQYRIGEVVQPGYVTEY